MNRLTICLPALLTIILITGCAERQDPSLPYGGNAISVLSRTAVRGQAMGVAMLQNTAYVSDRGFGISIYDLTDPAHPQLVDSGFVDDALNVGSIAVDSTGRLAAVETLLRIEVCDLLNGTSIYGFGTGSTTKIKIYYDGLTLMTYRTDFNPQDGFFKDFYPNTGTLAAPEFPSDPILHVNYPVGAYGFDLDLAANRAVTCMDVFGFALLDLNTVVQQIPEVLCQVNTPGATRDAVLVGDMLYLASGYDGLLIYDLSVDSLPVAKGTLTLSNSPNIMRIAAAGNRVYLLDQYDGVFAVDVSNPSDPVLVGSMSVGTARDFAIMDNLIVVADEDEGLIIGQIAY